MVVYVKVFDFNYMLIVGEEGFYVYDLSLEGGVVVNFAAWVATIG